MFKISIAQIPVESAQPKVNFETIKTAVENAVRTGSHLIVFPELCLPGYFNGDRWEHSSFLQECEHYTQKIAALSEKIHIIFGSVGCDWNLKNEDGRVRKYNASFLASHGKLVKNSKTNYLFWPKTLLPNYREFDDTRYFYDLRKLAYEKKCEVVNLYEPWIISHKNKEIKIGASLCEDGWDDLYSFSPLQEFAKKYAHDFFVNLSGSPFSLNKDARRHVLFSTLAKKISTPLLYVNCTGVQNVGKTVYGFDGSSTLYHADGLYQKLARPFEEGLKEVEFNVSTRRLQISALQSALDSSQLAALTPIEKYYQELQTALEYILKKTCNLWDVRKVVIGVSGGIDSALGAALMVRVLGCENVILVNMPSQFNSTLTQNAAKDLALNLSCAYTQISIENSIVHTQEQLNALYFTGASTPLPKLTSLVLENMQARDRGSRILAALAASLDAVFTCNVNKTELTVGYGTFYGDLTGFLCPIADLWKYDVYGLAKHYNFNVFQKEVIPQATFDVVPSPELSADHNVYAGQGDPIIYPYHDYLFRSWIEKWDRLTPLECLKAYLEGSLDKVLGCEEGLSQRLFPTAAEFCDDLERWWKLYQRTGPLKRVQAPPIVAVSRRAFGFDHRDHIGDVLFTHEYLELKEISTR